MLRGKHGTEFDGNTSTGKCQPQTHLEPREYLRLRRRRYLRQNKLAVAVLIFILVLLCLHSPFARVVDSSAVRIRCECCNAACMLFSLSTFGYVVQRRREAAAVSERTSSEKMRNQHGSR